MPRRREPDRPDALGHPWSIVFFQRHGRDDRTEAVPGAAFLEACPAGVRANLVAILKAVAEAPPPRFAGGFQWQAMHGDMAGFYEARAMRPGKRLYRVFCILARGDGSAWSEPRHHHRPRTSRTRPRSPWPITAEFASWATSIEPTRHAASSVERQPQAASAGDAALGRRAGRFGWMTISNPNSCAMSTTRAICGLGVA